MTNVGGRSRLVHIGVLSCVAVFCALPWLGASPFLLAELELVALLTLLVSGLNVTFGYAGQLALGHVAMYAAAAYSSAVLAIHGVSDVALSATVGMGVALVLGLVTGAPGLRLGAWPFAMASLFPILLIPDVVQLFADHTGGSSGLAGIPSPTLAGQALPRNGFYVFVVLATAAWLVALGNLLDSRHGISFLVLRHNPVLASSVGASPFRLKLAAYCLGALPAGLAGGMLPYIDRFLAPDSFNLGLTIAILAASVVGGTRSLYGAVVGAALLEFGPLTAASLQRFDYILYGGILLLSPIVFRDGLGGLLRDARSVLFGRRPSEIAPRLAPGRRAGRNVLAIGSGAGGTLATSGLSKRFGGVSALQGVSIRAEAGQITAIVGPNGSGKTTLLNVISGFHRPDEGVLRLGGRDITRMSPHRVARAGVARTFQTPGMPETLTAGEVVVSGAYGTRDGQLLATVLRLPRHWRRHRAELARAERVMEFVGIAGHWHTPAARLPLGTRRLVELARALAGGPTLLLLDEVASGLDDNELTHLREILVATRDQGIAVVLVEHNFQLVREIADVVWVLARGQVVAGGSPESISADRSVADEFLGATGSRR